VAHKLILNKGEEEEVHEFADIEEAFHAARSRVGPTAAHARRSAA
jgi:hypothetical protein